MLSHSVFSAVPLAIVGGTKLAAAATSGSFSILSMNVAGLPAILQTNDVPGDKATNAGTIGSDFAKYGYDVINIQELGFLFPSFFSFNSNFSSPSKDPNKY